MISPTMYPNHFKITGGHIHTIIIHVHIERAGFELTTCVYEGCGMMGLWDSGIGPSKGNLGTE